MYGFKKIFFHFSCWYPVAFSTYNCCDAVKFFKEKPGSLSELKPIVFVCHLYDLRFGLDMKLFVNIGNMFPDSKDTDIQDGGNLFGIFAINGMFQNPFFSFCND